MKYFLVAFVTTDNFKGGPIYGNTAAAVPDSDFLSLKRLKSSISNSQTFPHHQPVVILSIQEISEETYTEFCEEHR